MIYRELGNTGLKVSEVGFGAEMLENYPEEVITAVVRACEDEGINILDCWMPYPHVRTCLGNAIENTRDKWIIQGHVGATYQDGQYVRTRDMDKVIPAFEDLLERLKTDYIDLGMIHYIDDDDDYDTVFNGPFLQYVLELKEKGVIGHIGLSTHNTGIAKRAVESGIVEMIMFSINPAFDMMPSTAKIDDCFAEKYDESLGGLDRERAELYQLCEQKGIGITVMKGFGGGRLFDAEKSPFGVALTPVQCLHYALTRPAVASVMVGYEAVEHVISAAGYETASEEEKDYASVLASAPEHRYGAECMYCGHCQPCPMEIDIATANKFYDLAVSYPEVPESIRAHYSAMDRNANDCIGCGGCEERCPFGVKIVEKMEAAKELFGRAQ